MAGEWDDERASITGRKVGSNIPPYYYLVSARDRKIFFGIFVGVIGIGVLLLLLLPRFLK